VQDRQEKKWIKNSLYLSVIVNDYENRPRITLKRGRSNTKDFDDFLDAYGKLLKDKEKIKRF